MENEKAKIDTITSKTKVLAIGDKSTKYAEKKKKPVKYNVTQFKEGCLQRIGLLLMGSQAPISGINDSIALDWIGMERIKKHNQPDRFQFYCLCSKNHPNTKLWFFCTHNALALMHEVRKQLKDENWISKYVIESPLKADISRNYYNSEEYYIQRQVYLANAAELTKLYQFMSYLNFEHTKKSEKV